VLLDMMMPEMDGGEVYDRPKAGDSILKAFLASSFSIKGQTSDIIRRGSNGFIQKALDLKCLSDKSQGILGSSVG
jgi:two-component system cell cycle sensor histidine kinase/response regulator CckA